MIAEHILLERQPDPSARSTRPEPPPLFSVAERLALWAHQFGLPATQAEYTEALTGGLLPPPVQRRRD